MQLPHKPQISTFVSVSGGEKDSVTLCGEFWIGRVFELNVHFPASITQRHIWPLALCKHVSMTEIDAAAQNAVWYRHCRLWGFAQRIIALMGFSVVFPLMAIKRFFLGWNSGGLWKWGVFGLPIQATINSGDS